MVSNFDGLRVALLISGKGSTAATIIRKFQDSTQVRPVCAIASNPKAGLPNLIRAGLDEKATYVISPKMMANSVAFGEALLKVCREHQVDLVGHYGWLVKSPANLIAEYKDMIINQHPGPLDPGRVADFGGKGMYGMRVHYTRLKFVHGVDRDWWTEVTTHRVAEEYDKGAILDRIKIPINKDDTVETLADRALLEEHRLQVKVLDDFAKGKVQEWHRQEPLIKPFEINLLNKIKQEAIEVYK
ncbi:MAG: formyltransferase family protein [Candidatus Melainabacteria bacterium]|nr:formyltransferase family protein [Candidatus Melainabacteria bacterium]